jgi:NTE family protein
MDTEAGEQRYAAMQHDQTRLADMSLSLVMSGGAALGAYQAGAYQALQEFGLEPDWVVGGSAGAINGAVICGNPPEQRIAKLARLWHVTGRAGEPVPPPSAADTARRTQVAALTLATGQVDWCVPRRLYGPWWNPFGNPEPASFYDTLPLERRLSELADFDLLNTGTPRYGATAVDIETGADVIFDTAHHRITPRHVRASGALLPAFSPVEVEGRMVGDAGMSANLPIDTVLVARSDRPTLCIALDLLPLAGPRPRKLGETLLRTQDLLFAAQSRRAIAAWQAIHAERVQRGQGSAVTLLHVSYADQSREVSGKAFDFSPISAEARWQTGYRNLKQALEALAEVLTDQPGLHVHVPRAGGGLERVERMLAPEPA